MNCLSWLISVVGIFGDGGLEELTEALESRHAASRRVAIRGLAELGSPRAWELVIKGLEDPEGEVADEAQWQLARAPQVEALFGRRGLRSSDPWVRLRTAELLGRHPGAVEAWDLARHLSRREPDLSATLAWSLERLAREGSLTGDLKRCTREISRAVRYGGQAGASALTCLAALGGEELSSELDRAIKGKDVLLRAAAAEVLVRRGRPEDWERVERLAGDVDAGVRRVLVETLSLNPDRRAASLCVDRLPLEEAPAIRARLLHHLRSWSGLMHRYDPRPWKRWLEGMAEDWSPRASDGSVNLPETTRTFAGIPVRSDRLCVLVDLSGSIHTNMKDELTRRDFVELELERLLMALPKTAKFNVIGFCDEPHAWSDELKLNRRGRASETMEWFRSLKVRGKGDLFTAAELALRDPEVDTLVVFTDGVATGGRRWKLELMALLIEQECRFRGVSLDSVLVGASARTVRCWRDISERTGGHSMELEITHGSKRASDG